MRSFRPSAPGRWIRTTCNGKQALVGVTSTARTYRLVRDLYETMFRLLTQRGLKPRDAIDVQTFLWIGSGMARELRESRGIETKGDGGRE